MKDKRPRAGGPRDKQRPPRKGEGPRAGKASYGPRTDESPRAGKGSFGPRQGGYGPRTGEGPRAGKGSYGPRTWEGPRAGKGSFGPRTGEGPRAGKGSYGPRTGEGPRAGKGSYGPRTGEGPRAGKGNFGPRQGGYGPRTGEGVRAGSGGFGPRPKGGFGSRTGEGVRAGKGGFGAPRGEGGRAGRGGSRPPAGGDRARPPRYGSAPGGEAGRQRGGFGLPRQQERRPPRASFGLPSGSEAPRPEPWEPDEVEGPSAGYELGEEETATGDRAPLQKVCGVHAVRTLFARRPADIQRAYLVESRGPEFSDLLKVCAQMRRPYRIVPPEELERITDSRHHEGICVVAPPRPPIPLSEALRPPGAGLILALVDVGNPHNVGALIRSAVNFGARAALFPTDETVLSAAAMRIAQGGAEWIDIVAEPDYARVVRAARAAGFSLYATSSHGGRDLYAAPLPSRLIVLVGAENEGLPQPVIENADRIVSVPGTGHVESLNVGAAAAIVMGEHWRQHVQPGRTGT